MDKKRVEQFKNRWAKINNIEIKELQQASIQTHFKKLTAAIQLADSLHIGNKKNNDKQISSVRERWLKLKAGNIS